MIPAATTAAPLRVLAENRGKALRNGIERLKHRKSKERTS